MITAGDTCSQFLSLPSSSEEAGQCPQLSLDLGGNKRVPEDVLTVTACQEIPPPHHTIHLYIRRPSLLHVGPCEYHFGLVWRCLCAALSASSPGPLPGRLKPVAAGCRGTRRCYTETRPSSRSRDSRLPPMMVSSYPRIGIKGGKRSQGVNITG